MKKVSVLFLVISIFLGCEKDDICSSDTGTTPQLILRFYDIANQEETKAVPNLLVYGINSFNEIVVFDGIGLLATNTDSIAIPLQTSDNFTRFVLHRDLEDGDFETGNIAVVITNYESENIYVSRACGYKQIFNNLGIDLEPDPSNWVINSEILSTTVKNKNEAHVKIFH